MKAHIIFMWMISLVLLYIGCSSSKRPPPSVGIDFTRTGIDMELLALNMCSNSQIILSNYRANIQKFSRTHDVDAYFKSSLETTTEGLVSIKKCGDAISYNTCQSFINMRFQDQFCKILQDDKAFWSPAIRSSTPIFRCPFKAGQTYKFRNATINSELLQRFYIPLPGTIWEVYVSGSDEKRNVFACGSGQIKMLFYRKK